MLACRSALFLKEGVRTFFTETHGMEKSTRTLGFVNLTSHQHNSWYQGSISLWQCGSELLNSPSRGPAKGSRVPLTASVSALWTHFSVDVKATLPPGWAQWLGSSADPTCSTQTASNRQPLSSGTPAVFFYPILPSLSVVTGVRPALSSEDIPYHLLPPPPFSFTDIAPNKSLVCSSSIWHLLPKGSTLT